MDVTIVSLVSSKEKLIAKIICFVNIMGKCHCILRDSMRSQTTIYGEKSMRLNRMGFVNIGRSVYEKDSSRLGYNQ